MHCFDKCGCAFGQLEIVGKLKKIEEISLKMYIEYNVLKNMRVKTAETNSNLWKLSQFLIENNKVR